MKKSILVLLTVIFISPSFSQKMDFESYDPPSTLVVPEHKITKAKFPFIDVHNHQADMTTPKSLEILVEEMN